MIEVVIPLVNLDYGYDLMGDLEKNSLRPSRVVVIDNSPDYIPFSYQTKNFKLQVIKPTTPLGVNSSWNLGISKVSKKAEFVSILNDDIRLGPWFFQRVWETFHKCPRCGVACPNTQSNIKYLKKGRINYSVMMREEGWAFTIRKRLLNNIPPIPADRIKTFYGDNWFYYWSVNHNMYWYKDIGNNIYHIGGASVLRLDKRKDKKKEYWEWNKIKEEIYAGSFSVHQ